MSAADACLRCPMVDWIRVHVPPSESDEMVSKWFMTG